jgi:hypothetical protein
MDTNQNIYYGASDGRLFRRNLNSGFCQYLGTFNDFIIALVADIDGNVFAAGNSNSSNILKIYKYDAVSNQFSVIGNLPAGYNASGDLFFYEGKLFLTGSTSLGACLIDVNLNNLLASCCYMSIPISNPLIGAFCIKTSSSTKVYVVSENDGQGSNLYEINMITKTISAPICNYPFSILGCASIYNFSPSYLGSNACGVLPIKLSNFNLLAKNSLVRLTWRTDTEINNDYFLIQKSSDGINYETIGRVNGAMHSNLPRYYSFDDKTYLKENYYRLQQFDLGGNYTYSKTLYYKNESTKTLVIVPSSSNNFIKIMVTSQQKSELSLFNIEGVKLKAIKAFNGDYTMDISLLDAGIYVLQLIEANGQRNHVYFLKHK